MPFWSRQPSKSTVEENDLSSSSGESSPPNAIASATTSIAKNNDVGNGEQLIQQKSQSQPPPVSTSYATIAADNAIVTEQWTKIFPEAFGIRQLIEDSSFRWCWRESCLWGLATASAMYIHRRRMGSRNIFAGGVAYGTVLLVAAPSYYFCFRKREHQENVIEMMMAANDFLPGEDMPEEVPLNREHPFLEAKDKNIGDRDDRDLQKEFVARLKEKKDWQEPHQTQDVDEVFKEVKKRD